MILIACVLKEVKNQTLFLFSQYSQQYSKHCACRMRVSRISSFSQLYQTLFLLVQMHILFTFALVFSVNNRQDPPTKWLLCNEVGITHSISIRVAGNTTRIAYTYTCINSVLGRASLNR